jgi:Flp pilus assembly CpaF family ATPase
MGSMGILKLFPEKRSTCINPIVDRKPLKGSTRGILKKSIQLEELIHLGTLSEEIALFLEACVKAKLNILVCGGTGSGKTTLVNILSNFVPKDERMIMGDVRGETVRKLLKANKRLDGLLASGHASSPANMIDRLEIITYLEGKSLPIKSVREQITGVFDVIIQLSHLKDGTRKITRISEIQGIKDSHIVLEDIFILQQEIGKIIPTGSIPKCYQRIVHVPVSLFMEK